MALIERFQFFMIPYISVLSLASPQLHAAEKPTIVGVNVVAVDQQMSDQQQDALIEQLHRDGVTTIRTALGGQGDRYTGFVIKAFQQGIGSVVMVDVYAGNTGKHQAPANATVGRQWKTPALSDANAEGFGSWFAGELTKIEAAGVRITAFELGNELNTPRFNGDFPVNGTHRVLGLTDLNNPHDAEGQTIAAGYRAYLPVMAKLKQLRDHSKLNQQTPILSSMSANWGLPGPRKLGTMPDEVSVPDSIEYLRQNGMDKLADGYSVHFYPNDDPHQAAPARAAVLEQSGIFAASKQGSKPCWLTEWGLNQPNSTCPIDDAVRLQVVKAERTALVPYIKQGRVKAVLYYSWSGVPWDNENPGGIFRCGALTAAGKLALSPF